MDAKDWRSIPDGLIEFPLLPSSPELYHAIFGYFAAIPGLLSKTKRVTADTAESLQLSILSTAERLRDDMMQWYQRYISVDGGLRAPTLAKTTLNSKTYPFPSAYAYRDVLSASIITTFYAYIIVLNRDCINCLQPDCSHMEMNLNMAREICMSVDYCSRSGYCGAQSMKFSLPTAYSVMPVEGREWMEVWIEKFSSMLEAVKV